MSARELCVMVLLAISAITAIPCCLAVLVVKDVFDRMHYLAPVTTIAMPALLGAVAAQEGWGQATFKTILILFVFLLVNAVLSHATARAARVRDYGDWLPGPKKHVSGITAASERRRA
jgi:monovalent cation/proton antiporter MnhG/PhaG subunit